MAVSCVPGLVMASRHLCQCQSSGAGSCVLCPWNRAVLVAAHSTTALLQNTVFHGAEMKSVLHQLQIYFVEYKSTSTAQVLN